jgi:hypothetical protein
MVSAKQRSYLKFEISEYNYLYMSIINPVATGPSSLWTGNILKKNKILTRLKSNGYRYAIA